MTRRNLTMWIAAVAALMGVSLLGAYALQVRQVERELASLPLVRMDPVVITATRTAPAKPAQVAKTPTASSLR